MGGFDSLLASLGAMVGPLEAILGLIGVFLVSPSSSTGLGPNCTHHPSPPLFHHKTYLNLTQLKNLFFAGGVLCKSGQRPKDALPQRALLALKRPMGDISARRAGGIRFWESLGAVLGGRWPQDAPRALSRPILDRFGAIFQRIFDVLAAVSSCVKARTER